jgi:hypothetical protein
MRRLRRGTPDDGAREIHRLLTAPSPALERSVRQLAAVLPKGIELSVAPARQLVVDPALIRAVADLRGVYRKLRARIATVDTSSGSAKAHALDAIDLLDSSLTLLLRSADAHSYAAYSGLVHDARSRQGRAAERMRQAVRELG